MLSHILEKLSSFALTMFIQQTNIIKLTDGDHKWSDLFYFLAILTSSTAATCLCVSGLQSLSVKQRRLLLCCSASLSRCFKAPPWQKLQSALLIKKRSWGKKTTTKTGKKNAAFPFTIAHCMQTKDRESMPLLSSPLHGRLSPLGHLLLVRL